jgi:cysteine desulfurase
MPKLPRVYLDYAATTPLDLRVLEEMIPYFTATFGNPSSAHLFGQQAEAAVENARIRLAECIGCTSEELVFTSGGSESDNLAIRGAAFAARAGRGATHLLTTPIEHPAVRKTMEALAGRFGFELEFIPVDSRGTVDPDAVRSQLRSQTALVSVIHANNEIGTIQPIAEIAALCRANGIPFHTDSVQAAGPLGIDVHALNVDLLSIGAHKFYGPKGIGALYIRKGTALLPMQTGGNQEYGRRAGTQNVPAIVGMAAALEIAMQQRETDGKHCTFLRERILAGVLGNIPDVVITGHPTQRLPNHASFAFRGMNGNQLLMHLDVEGFAVSSGSACKTGDPEPSGVLLAIGLTREWALGSLRVTVGRATTIEEVDLFLAKLPSIIASRRALVEK